MPKAIKNIIEDNEDELLSKRGKRHHQKLKPFLILDYLMRETDEQNPATIDDIVFYLDEFGIQAERSSIKSDIDEINYVLYLLEEECGTIQIAVEDLDSGDFDEDKYILPTFVGKHRAFYVNRRRHDINEIDARLLAETVYTAPFLDEKRANRLVEIASTLVSKHSASRIKHDIPVVNRPRTTNKTVYGSVMTISDAMNAQPPKKISFKYQKYSIDNVEKTVDRKNSADRMESYIDSLMKSQ